MNVDPHHIRVLAHRIREQGDEVCAEAHELMSRAHAVGWSGLAGAAALGCAKVQARALAEIADKHDDAARALEAHAAAVEETMALIAAIERHVHSAVDAARTRLRRFLGGLLDTIDDRDEVLARFVPPPPGSPQWLQVRLPGLAIPGSVR
jgi:aminopeptidase N